MTVPTSWGDGGRGRRSGPRSLGQSFNSLPRSAPSALHSCAISQIRAATIGSLNRLSQTAFRDHPTTASQSQLGPVQKQVNHCGVMPREIGCFRFRSLNSCRSRPRPTSVESGASSSRHVMGCAPIEATWLLDRPLSRAMTLLCSTYLWTGPNLPQRQTYLEVRLVGRRNPSVLIRVVLRSGIVVRYIFSTSTFLPVCVPGAQIGNGRRPRHREDSVILHGEFKLQSLAPVAGIDTIGPDERPLFLAACLRFLGGFVVHEPVTLDHVQRLRVRGAETVDHGIRPDLDPHGVDHQRVAFVMTNGIPVGGRNDICGMRLVHAYLAVI